MPPLKGA